MSYECAALLELPQPRFAIIREEQCLRVEIEDDG
jgi:hypothetical protein